MPAESVRLKRKSGLFGFLYLICFYEIDSSILQLDHDYDKLPNSNTKLIIINNIVGAVCNPNEIWQMVDEILIAQSEWLLQYVETVKKATYRLNHHVLIQTQDYKGAARLQVKTVEEMALNRGAANNNAANADKAKERPTSNQSI